MNTPLDYMSLALLLAEKGRPTVSPNPMVGCVLTKENRIIGQGYHQRAGQPHAEINALQTVDTDPRGATAYVTLEPCCHHGRTPPCTDALIKAGIKKVYIACLDPNPLVAGKGVTALKNAGIEVEVGLCATQATQLNEIFFHYIQHKRPFVIAKWAMSLDGKTITHPHDTRQISNSVSQQHTHQLRQQVDAILVGANTACSDDPQLTSRCNNDEAIKQPLRIVLTTRGELPLQLKLLNGSLPGNTLIVTTEKQHSFPQTKQIEVLVIPKNSQGKTDLHALLDELGQHEITSLLVEGGMTIHHSFFQANLVNKTHVYIAPVIIGTLEKKHPLPQVTPMQLGQDIMITT